MQGFDYSDQVKENANGKSLLNEKRKRIFDFFSSSLTLIVVILLWVSFIFSIYNSISAFGTNGESGFSNSISLIINVALGVIIPIAAYKLYIGSKNKDVIQVDSGFSLILTYLKIIYILLIIIAIIFGLYGIILIFGSIMIPAVIVFILLSGGILYLAFYVLSLFKTFFSSLRTAFNSQKQLIPSAEKIKLYLIVVLIISVVLGLLFMVILQNIASILPQQYDDQLDKIQAAIDASKMIWFSSFAVIILIQAFFIYYANEFNKTFEPFNVHYSKELKAYKEQMESES